MEYIGDLIWTAGGANGANAKLHFRRPESPHQHNNDEFLGLVNPQGPGHSPQARCDRLRFSRSPECGMGLQPSRPGHFVIQGRARAVRNNTPQLTKPTDPKSDTPSLKARVLFNQSFTIQNSAPHDRSSKMTSDARSSPSKLQRQRSRNRPRP